MAKSKFYPYDSPIEKEAWISQRNNVVDREGFSGTYNYILKRSRVIKRTEYGRIVLLDEELKVYKKLQDNVIANLIIPPGVLVYTRMGEDKLRASLAKVHSLWDPFQKQFVKKGLSGYNRRFDYRKGSIVTPTDKFDLGDYSCASGIHFFLSLINALTY